MIPEGTTTSDKDSSPHPAQEGYNKEMINFHLPQANKSYRTSLVST